MARSTVKKTTQPVEVGGSDWEAVGAGATDQVLGTTGATGDFLARLVVEVATSATGTVSIKDGSGSAVPLVPANTPIGVYSVELGIRSTAGAWSITTGAGARVLAIGQFSP